MTRHRMDKAPHLPKGTGKKFPFPKSNSAKGQHVHSDNTTGSAGADRPQR
jgi:hypothetical protein